MESTTEQIIKTIIATTAITAQIVTTRNYYPCWVLNTTSAYDQATYANTTSSDKNNKTISIIIMTTWSLQQTILYAPSTTDATNWMTASIPNLRLKKEAVLHSNIMTSHRSILNICQKLLKK